MLAEDGYDAALSLPLDATPRGNDMKRIYNVPPFLAWAAIALFAVASVCLSVWAGYIDTFSYWKLFGLVVPALLLVLCFAWVGRDDGRLLKVVFLAFPVLGFVLPPKRAGISFGDIVALGATVLVLGWVIRGRRIPQKNVIAHSVAVLFIVFGSVALSDDFAIAFGEFLRLCAYCGLLIYFSVSLNDRSAAATLGYLLSVAIITVSCGIFFEWLTGINLSLQSANLNTIKQIDSVTARRFCGFFQDPQKAAQFLAVCISCLVALLPSCKEITRRILCGLAIVFGNLALLATASRAAIVMVLVGATLALLLSVSDWKRALVRALAIGGFVSIGLLAAETRPVAMHSSDLNIMNRFADLSRDLDVRREIWKFAYDISLSSPIVGIGPGTYQEYLIRNDPGLQRALAAGGYVPDQPESGYLKILVETGWLGLIALILVVCGAIWRSLRAIAQEVTHESRLLAGAALAGGAVYLVSLVTLFTPSDSRNFVIGVLLLSFSYANSSRRTNAKAFAHHDQV